MKMIQKIEAKQPLFPTKKKVAAYARVSMETDRLQHSLSAQVSYYSKLIQDNPEWEFKGVFTDYGISGTKASNRPGFQEMLDECEKGNIDLILTKSIKRFARNTVDLLNTVRHLKEKGIEVRFENENISSMSGDGELMLTILASFAQEESRSISDNLKWRIRKKYEQGIPHIRKAMIGYRWEGDKMVIVPEEAESVRFIFENYLKHISAQETANALNQMGKRTVTGDIFKADTVRTVLMNQNYTGDYLLQKSYSIDPFSKSHVRNHGEMPMYLVENHHEGIISRDLWAAVCVERQRRRDSGEVWSWKDSTSCFTSNIRCGYCDKNFTRHHNVGDYYDYYWWYCNGKDRGYDCPSKNIQEEVLKELATEVMGIDKFDEEIYREIIDHAEVHDWEITFFFKDGRKETRLFAQYNRKVEVIEKDGRTIIQEKKATPFTGMIHCEKCGAIFRANRLKGYKKEEKCYSLRCSSPTKVCPNNTIKEETLKQLVCSVFNLKEFDEEIMSQSIEHFYIGDNKVRVVFKDGREEVREYKDIKPGTPWTPEKRKKMLDYCKNNAASPFSFIIQCDKCGSKFGTQNRLMRDGSYLRYFSCHAPSKICPNNTIKEPVLEQLTCDVLGLEVFDATVMNEQLEQIFIANERVRFVFKDGHEVVRTYERKKTGTKWTEESKAKHSQRLKEYWTNRKAMEKHNEQGNYENRTEKD